MRSIGDAAVKNFGLNRLSTIPWEKNMSLITQVCFIAVLASRISRSKALPSNFSASLDTRWLKPDTPVVNHWPLAIQTSIKARQSLKCGRCTTSESWPLQILDNSKLKSWRFSRWAGFWRKIVLLRSAHFWRCSFVCLYVNACQGPDARQFNCSLLLHFLFAARPLPSRSIPGGFLLMAITFES